MVRQPWHQVEVQVGEPLGLGELHEVGLHAAGDSLQSGARRRTSPPSSSAAYGVSSVNDVTCRVGNKTSQPGSVLLTIPLLRWLSLLSLPALLLVLFGSASGSRVQGVTESLLSLGKTAVFVDDVRHAEQVEATTVDATGNGDAAKAKRAQRDQEGQPDGTHAVDPR